MSYINKIKVGDTIHLIEPTLYAECTTVADAATKQTAAIDNFSLVKGVQVAVKFTVTNAVAGNNLKLQIGTDTNTAKPIKYRGGNLPSANTLAAGHIYNFVYDGTSYWELVGDLDTNTHRPIQVNGTQILPNNNVTALNLKNGDNVNITNNSGTVTITATDTTYSFEDGTDTDSFKVTPSGGTTQIVTITPSWSKITGKPESFPPATHTHNFLEPFAENISDTTVTPASQRTAAGAIENYFNNNKTIIPRNKLISFSTSAYSNGLYAMGHFIQGYDDGPYGGFFVAHYQNPRYVGIANGNYEESILMRYMPGDRLTDGEVLIANGAKGKVKTTGYTIAKSVPADAVFTDTNKYHTTGSWGGTNNLTYTASAVNNADELKFTLATATTNAYGVTKLSSATDSDSEVLAATPKAIHTLDTKIDGLLAAANAMTFKGTLGTGGTITALPATHNAGDTYRVVKEGTYAGKYCEVGTLIICTTDGTTDNDAHWTSVETNEDGAVIGPDSSIENALVVWNNTNGRTIKSQTKVTYLDHAPVTRDGSTIARQDGLRITGVGYGNATQLLANETGAIGYGDGGPQIQFSVGSGSDQNAALIFTNYDNTSGMASAFHFVGQSAVAVRADGLIAKTRAMIGGTSVNSNYVLYVNGKTYINGEIITAGAVTANGGFTAIDASGSINNKHDNDGVVQIYKVSTDTTGGPASNGIVFHANYSGSSATDGQLFLPYSSSDAMQYRASSASGTFDTWRTLTYVDPGEAVGGAKQPVYVNSAGKITAGTALKNLAYKDSLSTSDIPNLSPSISIGAGTASNAPTVNVTVNGVSGTAKSITTATTGIYGVTKLSDAVNSTSTALAATANAVKKSYDLANAAVPKVWQYSTITKGTTPSSETYYGTRIIVDSGGTAKSNRLAVIEHCLDTDNVNNTYIRTYVPTSGSTNQTYLRIGSDSCVQTNGNIYAGTTTTTSERSVRAQTVAGNIYLYATGTATGNRGIYGYNNAGTGFQILTIDQNNKITYLAEATCNIVTSSALYSSGEGLHQVIAKNTSDKIEVSLHNAASGNHGIYSNGYGSTADNFTASGKWLIYRGTSGKTVINNYPLISSEGVSSKWNKARDNAIIKTSSIVSYTALASIKTTNGSWDIGAYDNASFTDDLLFSYVSDTTYSGNTAATDAQIKFLENGHIVAQLDGNASTATYATVTQTVPTSNTSYFLPFIAGNADGNYAVRANSLFYIYMTANGAQSYQCIGGSSSRGGITLHGGAGSYGNLIPAAVTENRTWTLPDATGTIALTSSTITGNAGGLTNKTFNSTNTIDNLSGTYSFQGSNGYWEGTDWVGFQVGSSNDKFQVVAKNGGLIARQNDHGGTDSTNWESWKRVVMATIDEAVGSADTPIYVNATGDVVAGTQLKALAYKDSLAASDIPDLSGSYLKLTGGALTGAVISDSKIISYSSGGIYSTTGPALLYWLKGNTSDTKNKLGTIFLNTGTTNNILRPDRYYFRQYSYDSSTGETIEQWDQYRLPTVTADKTGSNSYDILTSKSLVTIAQGGTGISTTDAHKVLIGPTSGSAAAPTWRTLAASDIPDLSSKYALVINGTPENQLIGFKGTSGTHHSSASDYNSHVFTLMSTLTGIFLWDNTGSKTVWSLDSTAYLKLSGGTVTGDLTVNGTLTGTLTGTADYAEALKNQYTYSTRIADADITQGNNGGVKFFLATGVMTAHKPESDGYILHFNWDNGTGWSSQFYIPNGGTASPQYRSHSNATTWTDWKTFLTSANYTSYTVTKTGSGASGTWDISISGIAAEATAANLTSTTNGIAYFSDTAGTFDSTSSILVDDANGKINVTGKSGSSGEFIAKRGSESFYFGFGTGNTNRGIYSQTAPTAHWMIYEDSDGHVYLPVGTGTTYWAVADATSSARGLVNTSAQQFKGMKRFWGLGITGYDGSGGSRYKDIVFQQSSSPNGVGGRLRYDIGDATNVSSGTFSFWEYSPQSTATTTSTGYAEKYLLPTTATGLTAHVTYNILTTKPTNNKIQFIAHSTISSGGGIAFVNGTTDYGYGMYHNTSNLWIGSASTSANVHIGGLYLHAGKNTSGHMNRKAFLSVGDSNTATSSTDRMIVYGDTDGNAVGGSTAGPVYIDEYGQATAISYVPISKGGTGTTTAPTKGGIIYASSTTAYACTAAGTANQVLISNGTNAPTWSDIGSISSTISTVGSLSNLTVIGTINAGGNILMGTGSNKTPKIDVSDDNGQSNRGVFAGVDQATAANYISNGALEIREQNRIGNVSNKKTLRYAPRIGFNWSGVAGGSLILNSSNQFVFYGANGTSLCPVYGHSFNVSGQGNDYAEYRLTNPSARPGNCVVDADDGTVALSTERLMPGAWVVSDTYGFTMGKDEQHQTLVAVAGRALVYTYRNRAEYHAGMAVCSAPNGTVDIMTREEIRDYPDCIVGIVSEIPAYGKWHDVYVNGRIWIKVR